jgi:hypothetical protein
MLLVASEGLECMNRSARRCSFYLENKKYNFFDDLLTTTSFYQPCPI